MTLERFGPMFKQVQALIALCDFLDEDRMIGLGAAYQRRGPDDGRYAQRAAGLVGRTRQVAAASWDLSQAIEVNGFYSPPNAVMLSSMAGREVAMGVATRDLIGTAWYGQSDYDRLVYPWKEIFPESV